MTRRAASGSSAARPRGTAAAAALLAALALSCAPPPPPISPERAARAGVLASYSGQLKVSLSGPQGRGRLRVLLAFRRPDALRLEVPGPTGARLVAVAQGERLTAVFPGERAAFVGRTNAADMEALLSVRLSPREMMDLLVGAPVDGLSDHRVRWGPALPTEVRAVLSDRSRLRVVVEDAEPEARVPDAAFQPPAHEGYRTVDAEEARDLLVGRRRRRP
jgi:hypothetical protein